MCSSRVGISAGRDLRAEIKADHCGITGLALRNRSEEPHGKYRRCYWAENGYASSAHVVNVIGHLSLRRVLRPSRDRLPDHNFPFDVLQINSPS